MSGEQTGNQRSGNLAMVVNEVKGHTQTNKDVFITAMMIPENPQIGQLLIKLPKRLETAVEDLGAVERQLDKLKKLATEKGYSDVLKILDEKLLYDRGYV